MLYHVTVQNIALIEKLELPLGQGLHVITGETGAGKSILIDAVNLVLGERADRTLIKSGCDHAVVEAAFDLVDCPRAIPLLKEQGLSDEDQGDTSLILSRELHANGRSICRINGRMATLSQLRELSSFLVDVHGQHEHQSLLSSAMHRGFLDDFGGEPVAQALAQCQAQYRRYRELVKKLENDFGDEQSRAQRLDMLRFQIAEIEKAKLQSDEEEQLEQQRSMLIHAEKIDAAVEGAYRLLYHGQNGASALEQTAQAAQHLAEVEGVQAEFAALKSRLDEAYYQLDDVASELRGLRGTFESDPAMLEKVENRLERIARLKRKYGEDIPAILLHLESAREEETLLQDSAAAMERLSAERDAAYSAWLESARELSTRRRQAAKRLEKALMAQLKDLGMGKARFEVGISSEMGEPKASPAGLDAVEFYISPNPGEPVRPLSRIASGGELSRLMLAIKNISAQSEGIPTLIFDEIDTGISGKMAQVVAEKMSSIALSHQVLCVTHLPQIAAMSDLHLNITKSDDGAHTQTHIKHLDEDGRIEELARMVGGAQVSDSARIHAREMLHQAAAYKAARQLQR